jgi:hypothetical protein
VSRRDTNGEEKEETGAWSGGRRPLWGDKRRSLKGGREGYFVARSGQRSLRGVLDGTCRVRLENGANVEIKIVVIAKVYLVAVLGVVRFNNGLHVIRSLVSAYEQNNSYD